MGSENAYYIRVSKLENGNGDSVKISMRIRSAKSQKPNIPQ